MCMCICMRLYVLLLLNMTCTEVARVNTCLVCAMKINRNGHLDYLHKHSARVYLANLRHNNSLKNSSVMYYCDIHPGGGLKCI